MNSCIYAMILFILSSFLWVTTSPELAQTLEFDGLKGPWFAQFKTCREKILSWSSSCLSRNTFTKVEENFELYCFEMLQNERFPLIVKEYFDHGWRKFWVLMLWNAPEWRISNDCWGILSPWLKKIFKLYLLEYARDAYFKCLYFHHGWRKFWNLMPLDPPRMNNFE